MFRKSLLSLVLALMLVGAFGALDLSAASVSSTFTSATTSSSLFVTHGTKVRLSLTGTWVGTVRVERSNNGGNAWELVDSFTANAAFDMDAPGQDFLYRLNCSTYTSGTVTYSIANVLTTTTRIKYATVPVGSVAYGSFGTSVSITLTTSSAVADLQLPGTFSVTGIGVLNGATAGTDKYVLALYDNAGAFIASTATAGTTVTGTNAFQQIALTTAVTLPAGHYYILLQMNGLTDKYRAVATNTFVDVVGGMLTGTTFGTLPVAITPPTTLTADQGPVAYIY